MQKLVSKIKYSFKRVWLAHEIANTLVKQDVTLEQAAEITELAKKIFRERR